MFHRNRHTHIGVPNGGNAQLMRTRKIRPFRREDGGGIPLEPPVTAGLIGNWDASRPEGVITQGGDGTAVVSLVDLSGVGNHLDKVHFNAPIYNQAEQRTEKSTAGTTTCAMTSNVDLVGFIDEQYTIVHMIQYSDGSGTSSTGHFGTNDRAATGSQGFTNHNGTVGNSIAYSFVDPTETSQDIPMNAWIDTSIVFPAADVLGQTRIIDTLNGEDKRRVAAPVAPTRMYIGCQDTGSSRSPVDAFFWGQTLLYNRALTNGELDTLHQWLRAKWPSGPAAPPTHGGSLVAAHNLTDQTTVDETGGRITEVRTGWGADVAGPAALNLPVNGGNQYIIDDGDAHLLCENGGTRTYIHAAHDSGPDITSFIVAQEMVAGTSDANASPVSYLAAINSTATRDCGHVSAFTATNDAWNAVNTLELTVTGLMDRHIRGFTNGGATATDSTMFFYSDADGDVERTDPKTRAERVCDDIILGSGRANGQGAKLFAHLLYDRVLTPAEIAETLAFLKQEFFPLSLEQTDAAVQQAAHNPDDSVFTDPDGPGGDSLNIMGEVPSYFGTNGPDALWLQVSESADTVVVTVIGGATVDLQWSDVDMAYVGTYEGIQQLMADARGSVVTLEWYTV